MAKKISLILKEFKISDDEILNIAIEPQLGKAANMLILAIENEWCMDKITAIKTIENLRKELL